MAKPLLERYHWRLLQKGYSDAVLRNASFEPCRTSTIHNQIGLETAMKLVKGLLLVCIVLPLLIVGGLIVLVLTLDPNRLKPVILKTALEHKVDLALTGDLSWQFYPKLGVQLGELSAKTLSGQPLVNVGNAAVAVKLMPLFKRDIQVQGIELGNATAYYWVAADGSDNWSSLTGPTEPTPTQETPTTSGPEPTIAIDSIAINGLTLDYKDAKSQQAPRIEDINLTVANLTLSGSPFPLQLSFTAKTDSLPPVGINFEGPIGLNLDAKTLNIEKGVLRVNSGQATAELNLSTQTLWGENLTSQGSLRLNPTSPKAWMKALKMDLPTMQSADALSLLQLETDYNYKADTVTAEQIKITLDKTALTGNLQLSNFDKPKIKSHWTGTTLVLDHYLPPETTAPPAATTTAASPLPLEPLRGFSLDTRLVMQSIEVKKLTLNKPTVIIKSKKGLIQLEELSAEVANGKVLAKGTFDATTDNALLNMTARTEGVDVGQLLTTFAKVDKINGLVFADATIESHGSTDLALKNNLLINAEVQSQALRVAPINLEKTYCQALAFVQQQQLPEFEWPKLTQLEPVKIKIQLKGSELNLENLSAQIAKLTGEAKGTFNTDTGEFNIPFNLSIGDFAGDIEGCLPIPEKWRKRQLPIRCKGNLESLGLKTCLPDTQLLGNLLKEKVNEKVDAEKARVERKLEAEKDQVEDKLKLKAREVLDKNVKEEDKAEVEDKVKNLLKSLKK